MAEGDVLHLLEMYPERLMVCPALIEDDEVHLDLPAPLDSHRDVSGVDRLEVEAEGEVGTGEDHNGPHLQHIRPQLS